ncbi:MAG: ATP--guanido phosphotransferase [Clostridia bacterium]|jgi:protein arginine kinase|nr:ATP--guanido phosphotransferase [Clostridia bacterium]
MKPIHPEILEGIVVKTRIRLARNLTDYPFRIKDENVAREIIQQVNRALVKCDTFNLYLTKNLSDMDLEAMRETHLISNSLIENREFGAALVNADKNISVMIHEEDVIREQCFVKGLALDRAYKKIEQIDDAISKNLNVAYDERLGYLTACPTNLGTGMRASVMLFLPALTQSGKIAELEEEVARRGLTIRGAYGEGTKAEGFYYQLSNEVTLGVSEYQILRLVEEYVIAICQAEREEMERLFVRRELKTMDVARKAYGILTNAVLLDYNEFLSHVAQVKLGAMLGMIEINKIDQIDELIVAVRPAVLCKQYGKQLSPVDRDLYRAEVVRNKLLKLKED